MEEKETEWTKRKKPALCSPKTEHPVSFTRGSRTLLQGCRLAMNSCHRKSMHIYLEKLNVLVKKVIVAVGSSISCNMFSLL
jgi:hypothetical protein